MALSVRCGHVHGYFAAADAGEHKHEDQNVLTGRFRGSGKEKDARTRQEGALNSLIVTEKLAEETAEKETLSTLARHLGTIEKLSTDEDPLPRTQPWRHNELDRLGIHPDRRNEVYELVPEFNTDPPPPEGGGEEGGSGDSPPQHEGGGESEAHEADASQASSHSQESAPMASADTNGGGGGDGDGDANAESGGDTVGSTQEEAPPDHEDERADRETRRALDEIRAAAAAAAEAGGEAPKKKSRTVLKLSGVSKITMGDEELELKETGKLSVYYSMSKIVIAVDSSRPVHGETQITIALASLIALRPTTAAPMADDGDEEGGGDETVELALPLCAPPTVEVAEPSSNGEKKTYKATYLTPERKEFGNGTRVLVTLRRTEYERLEADLTAYNPTFAARLLQGRAEAPETFDLEALQKNETELHPKHEKAPPVSSEESSKREAAKVVWEALRTELDDRLSGEDGQTPLSCLCITCEHEVVVRKVEIWSCERCAAAEWRGEEVRPWTERCEHVVEGQTPTEACLPCIVEGDDDVKLHVVCPWTKPSEPPRSAAAPSAARASNRTAIDDANAAAAKKMEEQLAAAEAAAPASADAGADAAPPKKKSRVAPGHDCPNGCRHKAFVARSARETDGIVNTHSDAFLSHVFEKCPNVHLLPRKAPPPPQAAGMARRSAAAAAEAAAADEEKYGALRQQVLANFCHCKLCRTKIGLEYPVPDCTKGEGGVPCGDCTVRHT